MIWPWTDPESRIVQQVLANISELESSPPSDGAGGKDVEGKETEEEEDDSMYDPRTILTLPEPQQHNSNAESSEIVANLRQELEEERERRKQIETEMDKLRDDLQKTTQSLSDGDTAAQERLGEAEKKHSALESKVQVLERIEKELSAALEAERSKLAAQKSHMENTKQALQNRLTRLEASDTLTSERLQEAEAENQRLEKELERLRTSQADELATQTAALRGRLDAAEAELGQVRQESDRWKLELETEKQRQSSRAAVSTDSNAHLIAEIHALDSGRLELLEDKRELLRRVEVLQHQLKELGQVVDDKEQRIRELQNSLRPLVAAAGPPSKGRPELSPFLALLLFLLLLVLGFELLQGRGILPEDEFGIVRRNNFFLPRFRPCT